MANIVSSNNLTSLYGSGQTTILTSTPVPNVAGTIPSRNLTTLYSGSGNPIQAVLPYGNSNVEAFLNAGTDGANSVQNIIASGNITADNVNTNTVFHNDTGVAIQSNAWAQLQYTNSAVAPASQYDIGTGSWFYVDNTGGIFQSNTTGTIHTVTLGNDGNVTANYFIGNVVGNITGNANFANYAGNVTVSNQPNITQLGNLLNLTSNGNVNFANAGNVTLGSNTNVHISGGNSGYVLATDGNSNLSWVAINTVGIANFANFAGNVTVSNQPNITQVGTLTNLDVSGNTLTNNLTINLQLSGNTANFTGNITSANANLGNIVIANYFSGDGSLLSNINGGNISNVANANYANFAGNAFSVNVANVVGIGNIATTNYDGNASNVLYGNGGFYALPTISNVANANYANFAGEAFNVNASNITGTVANANYSAYAGEANTANLATFATTANSVAGANVSGEVANANYASYANLANTANSVNVANVVGIGNIATTNYDGNSGNILYGNGGFYALPVISNVANANYANYAGQANTANLATFATTANAVAGANVSGQVANALVAGTVYTNAQPNITSVGNLINLNVTGNTTTSTSFQFVPTGINVGTTNTNAASFVITDYGLQPGTSNGQPLTYQFVKSRGNSATPVASSNNDQTIRFATNYFNGNTYPRNFLFNVLATQAANANFAGSNVAWAPGSFFLNTGHPFGNVTSSTATSSQNSLGFNQFGTLQITPGTYSNGNGTVGISVLVTSYGSNTDGAGQSGQIQMNRARGNRDGLLAVANNDGVGAVRFNAYNGNGYNTFAGIFANVNTATGNIGNGLAVPIDISIAVTPNTGNVNTTTFAASGNVTFPTNKAVTGGFFYGDGSNLSNISISTLANIATGGRLSLNTTGAGAPQFNLNGDGTVNSIASFYNSQASWQLDNVNGNTGFSPFRFQTYQNTVATTLPLRFWRSRGNVTTPLPVTASDEIVDMNFAVYGDSGNTYLPVGDLIYLVNSNDNAGNVTVNASLRGPNITGVGSTLTLGFENTFANIFTANYLKGDGSNITGQIGNALVAGTVYTNSQPNITSVGTLGNLVVSGNANIGNLKLNQYEENVYSYGNASGTITPDFVNGSIQSLTLTGNITLNSLGNAIAGRSMTLILTQDGTGNRTLTSSMKFAGNYKTLSTSASATDIISVFYTGTTYYASLTTGYA